MSQEPEISIEEFKKVDLRVAKVVKAERLPGAEKLLKLEVEIGGETRQIVAGIAKNYGPEDVVGKHIVVVCNLKPAKIFNTESRGMLLAAVNGDAVVILTPDKPIATGSRVS